MKRSESGIVAILPILLVIFLTGAVTVFMFSTQKDTDDSLDVNNPEKREVDLTVPKPDNTPVGTVTNSNITPSPANKNIIKTPTPSTTVPTTKPQVTNPPQQIQSTSSPTPEPTQYYSQEPSVLSASGPYVIGDSGPCFDIVSKHPYLYNQAIDYRFTNTESFRYSTLRLEGDTHVGTVCWVKDSSKTGNQYTFSVIAYTSSTPEKVYSNQVNLMYTHP